MILYENTVKNFINAANNRSLVKYMIDEYETATGSQITPFLKLKWKYMMNIAAQLISSTHGMNSECGIRIDLLSASGFQEVHLILASKDGNKNKVLFVDMIPWEDVRLSEEADMVYFDEGIGAGEKKTIHPSFKMAASINFKSSGVESESMDVKTVAFLYDCEYTHERDIITRYRRELTDKYPVCYIDQINKLAEYVKEILTHGGGTEVLRRLKLIGTRTENNNNLMYPAQKMIFSTVKNHLEKDELAWFVIQNPSGTGGSTLLDEIASEAEKQNKDILLIDKDEEADPEDFPKDKIVVWMYDGLDDEEQVRSVCRIAEENNIFVYKLKLDETVGLPDGGKGLNWIERYLDIGNGEKLEWNPQEYPIVIVDSPEDMPDRDGYANVIIRDNIYLDRATGEICGSKAARKAVYREISKGRNGVYLYIQDQALKEYLKKGIQDAKNKYNWLKEYIDVYSMDGEQLETAQKEKLSNESINKKYTDMAIGYMGRSAWDKLELQSKNWILSGLLAYHDMKKYDQLLDFSGVCISICKAVELETGNRFFSRYKQYLTDRYGDEAPDRAPYALVDDKGREKVFLDDSTFSLGKIPYLTGAGKDGKDFNRYAWNEFEAYCRDELLIKPEISRDTIDEHIGYTEKIRLDFRNQAAHRISMDVIQAKECIDYVVGIMHRLGIMLDAYRF
ncbi:MAG: hypothetical protein Q4E54_04705 [Lachnospiraceae bacterium]|nr:hypothetical protein [Lachnospiraceae bacterium]